MNAVSRQETERLAAPAITFQLNGRTVSGSASDTLLQIAKREGVAIPHLCHKDGLEPAGNCRACMVEIAGERVLAPSCCRCPSAGMVVNTDSPRALRSQKLVLELLQADMPDSAHPHTRHSELEQWATTLGVGAGVAMPRFEARALPAADLSHPAIAVNMDACIQCTRCLRACRDEQGNDVIGLAGRGEDAKIVFDMDDPMARRRASLAASACRPAQPAR